MSGIRGVWAYARDREHKATRLATFGPELRPESCGKPPSDAVDALSAAWCWGTAESSPGTMARAILLGTICEASYVNTSAGSCYVGLEPEIPSLVSYPAERVLFCFFQITKLIFLFVGKR